MKKLSLLLIALLALMSAEAANAFYNVRDYGAKGDGSNIDSHAINTAIEEASKNGGGTIYLPAGTYTIKTTYKNTG